MLKEDNITASDVLHNIPEDSGIYIVTTSDGQVLYIGSSTTLRRRIAYLESHTKASGKYLHNAADLLMQYQASGKTAHVHYIVTENYRSLEKELIDKYDPPWNKQLKR